MNAASQANNLLPRQHTSFVGRKQEIQRLTELLNDPFCRLLTLSGHGGVGKTRLALEITSRAQADFPDGVYFVDLQPLQTASQVLSATIDSVGVEIHQQAQPELLAWMGEKHLLLLMDNFEHVLEAGSLLTAMLDAAPQIKILVTSRVPLKLQAEWVRQISGLDYPTEVDHPPDDYGAIQLFVERARQRGIDLDSEREYAHIVRICQLVEGSPLALELAAGWVDSLSCAAIAQELNRSLSLLTAGSQDIPPRHQSMQTVFDHSWHLLNPQEQAIMRRFSVFRGGATREAAEQVTGATVSQLAALVGKSLLRHDAGRYSIHELVRQYAGEQLVAAEESEATKAAHSAYFASFMDQQWKPMRTAKQVSALNEIEADFDNIRSAWQTAVESYNAAGLSMMVYPLWYYSDLRDRYLDALSLYSQAENAREPHAGSSEGIDRVIGQLRTRRGFLYVSWGKPSEGRNVAATGLEILQRCGTDADCILALDSLCLTSLWCIDYPAFKAFADQAVRSAETQDDRWLLARVSYWRALAATWQLEHSSDYDNDLREAKRLAQAMAELAEACGDLWLRGLVYGELLSGIAFRSGSYHEAVELHQRGIRLFEELGQIVTIVQNCWGLGTTYLAMKDYANAEKQYFRSLKLLSEHSAYPSHKIDALGNIADLWRAQGNLSGAIELYSLAYFHPATIARSREYVWKKLQELETEVSKASFAAAQERGRRLDLKQTVKQVLDEMAEDEPERDSQANTTLPDPLTPRELEVLRLLTEGLTNKDIARRLVITEGTVRGHLNKIYGKLGVENRVQAVKQAQSLRLLLTPTAKTYPHP